MVVDVEFCRLLTWKERGGARLACCPCIWWVYLSHPFIGLIGIYEPWLLFLFQDGYCYALDDMSMVDSRYNYTCLVSLFDDRMVWLKWGCFWDVRHSTHLADLTFLVSPFGYWFMLWCIVMIMHLIICTSESHCILILASLWQSWFSALALSANSTCFMSTGVILMEDNVLLWCQCLGFGLGIGSFTCRFLWPIDCWFNILYWCWSHRLQNLWHSPCWPFWP